jgi:hypothetical protein
MEPEGSLPNVIEPTPPLVLNLSQMNAVHNAATSFSKIDFNIILCLCLPNDLFPAGFSAKSVYVLHNSTECVPNLATLISWSQWLLMNSKGKVKLSL